MMYGLETVVLSKRQEAEVEVVVELIFIGSDENGEDYKLAGLRWFGHVQRAIVDKLDK